MPNLFLPAQPLQNLFRLMSLKIELNLLIEEPNVKPICLIHILLLSYINYFIQQSCINNRYTF